MILYQLRFLVMCPTQILLSAVHLRLGRVLAMVFCIQELQSVDIIVSESVISITILVKCTTLRPQGSTLVIKSQDPDNFLKIVVYLVTSERSAKYLHKMNAIF